MGGGLSSIAQCSASLRRKLKIEEEEALRWVVKIPRLPQEADKSRKPRGGRWHLESSLSTPGPFWHRPRSPEGKVSFHFAFTTVSKGSGGRSMVSSPRGGVEPSERTPADHDVYIAREDGVMTVSPSEFEGYAAKVNGTDDNGVPAVALLSNISDDPKVRASFWDAVDECERKPGEERLILEPTRGSKKEWASLAANQAVAPDIRAAAAEFAAGTLTKKISFPMSEREANEAIAMICVTMPNADRKKGPVRFAQPRHGRTQYRLEVELPEGLDNVGRLLIMAKVAKDVEATGAMYTIVIHKPDEHNDARNYHLHLVAYDRPARLIDGAWDFTIASQVEGQASRTAFEQRQKKITIAGLKKSSNRGDFTAYLKALRVKFADICNEELKAAGQDRLLDPRKYSEMGIERKPTKPLGTLLAPLEAAGVATSTGIYNAEIIWTGEFQTRKRECEAKQAERLKAVDDVRKRVAALGERHPDRQRAVGILTGVVEAAGVIDRFELDMAQYEVTLAMAQARPKKVIETCSRIIQELQAGRGKSTDRRNRSKIVGRFGQAKAFLDEINRIDLGNQQVIAEMRPSIDAARATMAAAAAKLDEIANAPAKAVAPQPVAPVRPQAASLPAAPQASPALPSRGPAPCAGKAPPMVERVDMPSPDQPATPTSTVRRDPARDKAVAAYVEVVRTSRNVRIIVKDGVPRVDPTSVQGWELSAQAFEDEPDVQSAVNDRWEVLRAKEAEKARERFDKKQLIFSALEKGELIARPDDDKWEIEGADEELWHQAFMWQRHADLVASFEKNFRKFGGTAPAVQPPAPAKMSPPKGQPVQKPSTNGIASQTPAPTHLLPSSGRTLAEQMWAKRQQSRGLND